MNGARSRAGLANGAAVAAVLAACLYLYGALLDREGFSSHEKIRNYLRAAEYLHEFRAGHWPRVFPHAFEGAGMAFPRFYPPLAPYVATGLAALVGDVMLGVNLAFFASALLSALAMYGAVRRITGSTAAALLGAAVYGTAPYRFVDLFVRGALAESWTFVWYPLLALGLWRIVERKRLPLWLPLSVAGLLLTHPTTALYVVAGCFALPLVMLGRRAAREVAALAVATALGAGLAAWFLVPQQCYLPAVRASDPEIMGTDPGFLFAHRVLPSQLLAADPARWWGLSMPAPLADGMSFALGWGQLALPPLALLSYLIGRTESSVDVRARRLAAAVLAAWALCVAFVVWPLPGLLVLPRPFMYIQFPWRLLGPAAFLGALGAALHLARLPDAWRRTGALAAAVLVVAVPGYQRSKRSEPTWTAGLVTDSLLLARGDSGYVSAAEYLPKELDPGATRDGARRGPVLAGEGRVLAWRRWGGEVVVSLEARSPARLVFPLVYYDFYQVRDASGRPLPAAPDGGFLSVRLPPGRQELRVGRRITAADIAGLMVTAVSAAGWGAVALRRRRPTAAGLAPVLGPEPPGSGRAGVGRLAS